MIERLQLLSLLHAMCCNAGQKVSTTITNTPISKFLEKKNHHLIKTGLAAYRWLTSFHPTMLCKCD